MTVEDLLIFGKSHCHSDHAKILLAEIIEKNPLELLNYLKEEVPVESDSVNVSEMTDTNESEANTDTKKDE